jgi:hypothetical protein
MAIETNQLPSVESKVPAGQPAEAAIVYSEDGVDLTLIRWMLSLTPTERLQVLQDTVRSIARLKGEETED